MFARTLSMFRSDGKALSLRDSEIIHGLVKLWSSIPGADVSTDDLFGAQSESQIHGWLFWLPSLR